MQDARSRGGGVVTDIEPRSNAHLAMNITFTLSPSNSSLKQPSLCCILTVSYLVATPLPRRLICSQTVLVAVESIAEIKHE